MVVGGCGGWVVVFVGVIVGDGGGVCGWCVMEGGWGWFEGRPRDCCRVGDVGGWDQLEGVVVLISP